MSTVYQTKTGLTSGSSVVLTLDSPVGSGRSLVVFLGRSGSTDRTYTVSDDGGGSYGSPVFNIDGSVLREVQLNVCLSAVAGTQNITVTGSGTAGFSAVAIECDALHATLYDDARGTSDEAGLNTSHVCADSPGVTTANDVLLIALSQASASFGTITYPSGYTSLTGISGTTMAAYKLAPSGVSGEQASWSATTARQGNNVLQALRFAAAGAASSTGANFFPGGNAFLGRNVFHVGDGLRFSPAG